MRMALVLSIGIVLASCSPVISVGSDHQTKSAPIIVSRSCGNAPAYVRTRTVENSSTSHCLRWTQRALTFQLEDGLQAEHAAAIRRAVSSWRAASQQCSDLTLNEGNSIIQPVVGLDSQNVLMFRKDRCVDVVDHADACWTEAGCGNSHHCWDHEPTSLAITTISYSRSTGEILDADIEFNSASFLFTTVDTPVCPEVAPSLQCVASDFQSVVTHEVGHFLGLSHVDATNSTMRTSAEPGTTDIRVIDQSSACFVCDVYQIGRPAADCVAP